MIQPSLSSPGLTARAMKPTTRPMSREPITDIMSNTSGGFSKRQPTRYRVRVHDKPMASAPPQAATPRLAPYASGTIRRHGRPRQRALMKAGLETERRHVHAADVLLQRAEGVVPGCQGLARGGREQDLALSGNVFAQLAGHVHLMAEQVLAGNHQGRQGPMPT